MSLADRSVAAHRALMLKASSLELVEMWKKSHDIKGGDEHCIYQEMILKDVLAYGIVRFVHLIGGEIFGGFVVAHISGKLWSDLDVRVPSSQDNEFMKRVISFLCMMLGFKKQQIRYEEDYSDHFDYMMPCRRYTLRVSFFKEETLTRGFCDVSLKIDVCTFGINKSPRNLQFNPVTIGRCLVLNSNGISFQNQMDILERIGHWHIWEIMELLADGQDVKFAMSANQQRKIAQKSYRAYYWTRITKLQKNGWELLPADGLEPVSYKEAELKQIMSEMNMLTIS